MPVLKSNCGSEEEAVQPDICKLLERAIQSLPESYRVVVVLREVEKLEVTEIAATLNVKETVVMARLRRALAMLRRELHCLARGRITDLYSLRATRCDRILKGAFDRMHKIQEAKGFSGASKLIH